MPMPTYSIFLALCMECDVCVFGAPTRQDIRTDKRFVFVSPSPRVLFSQPVWFMRSSAWHCLVPFQLLSTLIPQIIVVLIPQITAALIPQLLVLARNETRTSELWSLLSLVVTCCHFCHFCFGLSHFSLLAIHCRFFLRCTDCIA